MIRHLLAGLLLSMVSCMVPTGVRAQDTHEDAASRSVPLRTALVHLSSTASLDLVYAEDLVAGRRTACTRPDEGTAEARLQCLLDGTGLAFVRSSTGAYVLFEEEPLDTATVSGRVTDAATGSSLARAEVLLTDLATGTTSDDDGRFALAGIPRGMHRLLVSYVGYAPFASSVAAGAGDSIWVAVALRADPLVLEPILVDAYGLPELAVRRIDEPVLAGAAMDYLRSAAMVPGVTTDGATADLHLQGGAAGEHVITIDGVPVRNPFVAGRFYGAFSPLAVSGLSITRAGFGAANGSNLSGTVDATTDVDGGARLALGLDPIGVNARARTRWRVAAGRTLALMAAVRSSIWPAYHEAGLRQLLATETGTDASPFPSGAPRGEDHSDEGYEYDELAVAPFMGFTDVHLAARYDLSPAHALSASFYRGTNTLSRTGVTDGVLNDTHAWHNRAAQLRWSWQPSSRTSGTLQLRESRYDVQHAGYAHVSEEQSESFEYFLEQFRQPALAGGEGNSLEETALQADATFRGGDDRVHVGLTTGRSTAHTRLMNQYVYPRSVDAATWTAAGYLSADLAAGGGLHLTPGLRLTWLSARRAVYGEPRLAVELDRSLRPEVTLSVRLAGGLYRQFVNEFALTEPDPESPVPSFVFWLPATPDVAPPRARHAAASAQMRFGRHWTVGVDAYYKAAPRLLAIDYTRLASSDGQGAPSATMPAITVTAGDFISAVRGRAYGTGVEVRRRSSRFEAGMAYDYSRSFRQVPGRFDGAMVAAPWDVPHRFLFSAQAQLLDDLSFDAGATVSWGRSWPLARSYYDYGALAVADAGAFGVTHPYAHRLPARYQLNAGLTFSHAWRPGTVQLHVAVLNVLDARNVYERILEPAETGLLPVERLLPGRRLSISIRLSR